MFSVPAFSFAPIFMLLITLSLTEYKHLFMSVSIDVVDAKEPNFTPTSAQSFCICVIVLLTASSCLHRGTRTFP
jgi:hypothetical protein